MGPEIILEAWAGRDVALVIAEEIQRDFIGGRTGQIKIIERIAVWRNRGHVRHTVCVLAARRVWREEAAECLSKKLVHKQRNLTLPDEGAEVTSCA